MSADLRRVLLLAYYFPPSVGVASERMASFHRHLPAFNWDPTVLTPREPHFHRAGPGDAVDPDSVVRTSGLELSRLLRRLWGGAGGSGGKTVAPIPTGATGSLLRRLVREWVYVPDAQVGWIPTLVAAGSRILEGAPSDRWVIFSSSVPYSAHLAAGRLAARHGLPWVAEFRDPWSTREPAADTPEPADRPRSPFRRALDRRMEEAVLRGAGAVVVTSRATKKLLTEAFPRLDEGKVSVVTNGYEPMPPGRPPEPHEPMALVHAGTLQDPDYVRPLLAAASKIDEEEPGALRIVSYGDPGPWLSALSSFHPRIPGWMELKGVVEPGEARKAMQDASGLLVFYPGRRFAGVLPGKLFPYLGARRPIFGAVPPGSEMEELLGRTGDRWLVRDWGEAGILAGLRALLREHRAGRIQSPRVPEETVSAFTREAQAGRLARVLDAVAGEGKG